MNKHFLIQAKNIKIKVKDCGFGFLLLLLGAEQFCLFCLVFLFVFIPFIGKVNRY